LVCKDGPVFELSEIVWDDVVVLKVRNRSL